MRVWIIDEIILVFCSVYYIIENVTWVIGFNFLVDDVGIYLNFYTHFVVVFVAIMCFFLIQL